MTSVTSCATGCPRTWPWRLAAQTPAPAQPAPAVAATDETLFDAAVIRPLFERRARGDDAAFVTRVLDLYRKHGPEALGNIVAAHKARDADALARAAHALEIDELEYRRQGRGRRRQQHRKAPSASKAAP